MGWRWFLCCAPVARICYFHTIFFLHFNMLLMMAMIDTGDERASPRSELLHILTCLRLAALEVWTRVKGKYDCVTMGGIYTDINTHILAVWLPIWIVCLGFLYDWHDWNDIDFRHIAHTFTRHSFCVTGYGAKSIFACHFFGTRERCNLRASRARGTRQIWPWPHTWIVYESGKFCQSL